MADTIIKATSGGSLKIQQESGVDALTVDTSGNIQLAGTMTAGTIGSAVAVDNCIIKKWHYFGLVQKSILHLVASKHCIDIS